MHTSGRLFYLLGASGAGKDSLMDFLRQHLPSGAPVEFARRYITRCPKAGGEVHESLSEAEFESRLRQGGFIMHWRSHGFSYGIGREVGDWLAQGRRVVVNGSRAYLAEAAAIIPDLYPVQVTVEPEVLRQRLELRSRETPAEIAQRLQRAMEYHSVRHPRLVTIDNSGDLERAGEELMRTVMDGLR